MSIPQFLPPPGGEAQQPQEPERQPTGQETVREKTQETATATGITSGKDSTVARSRGKTSASRLLPMRSPAVMAKWEKAGDFLKSRLSMSRASLPPGSSPLPTEAKSGGAATLPPPPPPKRPTPMHMATRPLPPLPARPPSVDMTTHPQPPSTPVQPRPSPTPPPKPARPSQPTAPLAQPPSPLASLTPPTYPPPPPPLSKTEALEIALLAPKPEEGPLANRSKEDQNMVSDFASMSTVRIAPYFKTRPEIFVQLDVLAGTCPPEQLPNLVTFVTKLISEQKNLSVPQDEPQKTKSQQETETIDQALKSIISKLNTRSGEATLSRPIAEAMETTPSRMAPQVPPKPLQATQYIDDGVRAGKGPTQYKETVETIAKDLYAHSAAAFINSNPVDLCLLKTKDSLQELTEAQNQTVGLVQSDILSSPDLPTLHKKCAFWLDVGNRCLTTGDFHSAFAISSVLNDSNICRLTKTELAYEDKRTMMEDTLSPAGSFKNLRALEETLSGKPTIPLVAILKGSLDGIEDKNPKAHDRSDIFEKIIGPAQKQHDCVQQAAAEVPLTQKTNISSVIQKSQQKSPEEISLYTYQFVLSDNARGLVLRKLDEIGQMPLKTQEDLQKGRNKLSIYLGKKFPNEEVMDAISRLNAKLLIRESQYPATRAEALKSLPEALETLYPRHRQEINDEISATTDPEIQARLTKMQAKNALETLKRCAVALSTGQKLRVAPSGEIVVTKRTGITGLRAGASKEAGEAAKMILSMFDDIFAGSPSEEELPDVRDLILRGLGGKDWFQATLRHHGEVAAQWKALKEKIQIPKRSA